MDDYCDVVIRGRGDLIVNFINCFGVLFDVVDVFRNVYCGVVVDGFVVIKVFDYC